MNIAPFAFLQNLRAPEIILIFLAVLLFFGAKRLPEIFRSLGKSLKEFKKATSGIEDDIRNAMDEEPRQTPTVTNNPKQVSAQDSESITESEKPTDQA
jgi:sec-independent protein translocase protein TatA